MRFTDEATILISSGHGGPGSVSFRREKYVPRGGPNGGDGGKGGDIWFEASTQLSTLYDFRFKRKYAAPDGERGGGGNKSGKDGDDITLKIPAGTAIRDADTGEIFTELLKEGDRWLACKGGRGGKGNAHFATSTHQAPKFAQPGEEGDVKRLTLELKLLADVGIIGYPNAGKSTLISKLSAARPKIADYAFTTLVPNLGVVALDENPDYTTRTIVVADIPGLIEGAHRGMGLGHKFLKHIEKTRIFLHLLDGVQLLEKATDATIPEEHRVDYAVDDCIHSYKVVRSELRAYDESLIDRPEIVVLNKADILSPELIEATVKRLRKQLTRLRGTPPHEMEPLVISAVAGVGLDELRGVLKIFFTESAKGLKRLETPTLLPDGTPIPSQHAAPVA